MTLQRNNYLKDLQNFLYIFNIICELKGKGFWSLLTK